MNRKERGRGPPVAGRGADKRDDASGLFFQVFIVGAIE